MWLLYIRTTFLGYEHRYSHGTSFDHQEMGKAWLSIIRDMDK